MKTLFLLRHAKSQNLAPGLTDFDRSLKESGRRQAQSLGRSIKEQKFDLVLCSTAARARETTEIVLGSAELTTEVHYEQAMYEAKPTMLLQLITKIENGINTVLMVGHNPAMEELVQLLTGQAEQISTCTLAQISLAADEWSKVESGNGTLDRLVRP